MKNVKKSRIEVWRAMSGNDKTTTVCFSLATIAAAAYGLYLVGSNGVLLLAAGLFLYLVTEIFRSVELKLTLAGMEEKSVSQSNGNGAKSRVDVVADNKDNFIPNTIEKRNNNPQQGLLAAFLGGGEPPEEEIDEEQARKDHEDLVEYFRKKEESMRTAKPVASGDESVRQAVIDKQKAYLDELMEPTIVPVRELSEKQKRK